MNGTLRASEREKEENTRSPFGPLARKIGCFHPISAGFAGIRIVMKRTSGIAGMLETGCGYNVLP